MAQLNSSRLNYLIIERPFYITSTGEVLKEKSYFVYSSAKSQFSSNSFLEGIYKNADEIKEIFNGKFSFGRSNYMINEIIIQEAFHFIEDFLDDNPNKSLENALVEAINEFNLSYEEIEILEKRCFDKL